LTFAVSKIRSATLFTSPASAYFSSGFPAKTAERLVYLFN